MSNCEPFTARDAPVDRFVRWLLVFPCQIGQQVHTVDDPVAGHQDEDVVVLSAWEDTGTYVTLGLIGASAFLAGVGVATAANRLNAEEREEEAEPPASPGREE